MALPSDRDVQLALLRVVRDAGGEARPRDVYDGVSAQFPRMTPEDLSGTLPSGGNRWTNRIQWMRQKLVAGGELAQHPRGIWRITDRGRTRLESEGVTPPPHFADSDNVHRQLQNQIAEIGVLLGHYASKEHKLDPYRYDVVWKKDEWQPSPGNVFEVQHHGSLEGALLKLKHAHDVCKPRLCLVVTGEGDEKKVAHLLSPLFSGVFHEIKAETLVMTAQQVADLHEVLTREAQVLRRLVGK
jgi:hypothetical protein